MVIAGFSFAQVHYDREADVLYLHRGEPTAGEARETAEGHLLRFAPGSNRLVGATLFGVRHLLASGRPVALTVPQNVTVDGASLERHLEGASSGPGAP